MTGVGSTGRIVGGGLPESGTASGKRSDRGSPSRATAGLLGRASALYFSGFSSFPPCITNSPQTKKEREV